MLLIKNACVYAPAPLGKQDVLTSYNRVLLIGDDLNVDLPDVEVIDAAGKLLVPGFIDQHVHITGGGGESGFHSRIPELRLSDAVEAGVTTLVGLTGTDSITRSVEALLAKTKAFNYEGVTAFCITGAYQYPPITLTGSVLKDIAFIEEIIGCKLAISDNRSSHPSREEIIRLVSDIRAAALLSGKTGVLHLHVGQDPQGINTIMDIIRTTDIPISHFRPTHMNRHLGQAVEFTRLGGYADFTAGPFAEMAVDLISEAAPELITISSDAGGSYPIWDDQHVRIIGMKIGRMTSIYYDMVKEMVVKHSVPLELALCLITKNVAQALGLYPRKGSISVGADADIVILDESLDIDSVIAKGKIMMIDKEIRIKDLFE